MFPYHMIRIGLQCFHGETFTASVEEVDEHVPGFEQTAIERVVHLKQYSFLTATPTINKWFQIPFNIFLHRKNVM